MNLSAVTDISQGIVTAGRGAGARPGDWRLSVVESADIVDGRVDLEGGREIDVERTERAERHLLRPFDILVTARAQNVRAALVPPEVSRTVAGSTLLVVRTPDPGSGLAHFIWYYLTSTRGRAELAARLTATSLPTLSVKALGNVPLMVPPPADLRRLVELIEASQETYDAAIEAARIRHEVLRDSIIAEVAAQERGVESAQKG